MNQVELERVIIAWLRCPGDGIRKRFQLVIKRGRFDDLDLGLQFVEDLLADLHFLVPIAPLTGGRGSRTSRSAQFGDTQCRNGDTKEPASHMSTRSRSKQLNCFHSSIVHGQHRSPSAKTRAPSSAQCNMFAVAMQLGAIDFIRLQNSTRSSIPGWMKPDTGTARWRICAS